MKNTNRASRWINQLVAVLFLLSSPLAVYAACCSGHGGVASCNKTTGFQMCKDGTASPTCKCKKEKTTTSTKQKTTKKTTATPPTTTTTPTTTTKPKTHWWSGKSTTTKPATSTTSTTTNGTSNKGCCSKHGGVGQCNKSTGYLTCKDGSQSPSCACH
ncbi:hypothetical protein [Legionella cherrii]|uniref:Neurogenic locus notch like protein n=1 Tax=Legionella cherrii TaxID=28084 RepID=A0A0W0SAA7_9GAMM|nr:hypothetical protein [Legionella cherrii]KTC80059.1 hypothetical protein Lche_2079 [Legionella cherrii]VEB38552.1 Uncharacterised protein [Legionella cherrii]